MSLKERITDDIKAAMKAKDKVRLETVRGIKKILIEKEVEARGKGQDQLTEQEEMEVLVKAAKQRRDSIEQYRNGGREDLVANESAELAIIEEYLPQQLSEEEVTAAIEAVIAEVGASSAKDMGKVMGPVMAKLKGKADGKLIQSIVKSKLAG
jgi:uncharacterized protein YqeY